MITYIENLTNCIHKSNVHFSNNLSSLIDNDLKVLVKPMSNKNSLEAVKKGAAKQSRINRTSEWHLT